MLSRECCPWNAAAPVAPHDLVPEVLPPEHRVRHGLEVVARGRVAVQVQAPGRLEHPAHREQPHGHEAQERAHAVGVRGAGALDNREQPGMVVGDLVRPFLVHVALP